MNKDRFDPGSLNDPIATMTEWSPLKSGGSNFKTHSLKKIHGQRFEFHATLGMLLFAAVFLLIGIGVVIGFGVTTSESLNDPQKSFETPTLLLLLFGMVFGGAGAAMLVSARTPTVFDLNQGYFCRSRKKPEHMIDPTQLKQYARLTDIHALQLVSEHCTSSSKNKSSYYSYELNLVLNDGSRVHVVDHGKLTAMRDDARLLADHLGKPLWDAT